MYKRNILLFLIIIVVAGVAFYFYQHYTKIEPLKISATDVPPPRFLFAVIKDRQLDLKHGLNLELLWASPGEVERRLVERFEGVEIGYFNVVAVADTNSKKAENLRVVAPMLNLPQVLLVGKNSPFYGINDLKGARITIRPKGTAAYTAQAVVLKVAGFDIERDFRIVFGEPQQGAVFLEKGEADAIMLSPPDAAPLLATGKYRLVTELDEIWKKVAGASFPFVDMAAHADWIAENPRKVERFRATLKEAVALIKENPQIVGDYRELLNIKSDAQLKSVTNSLVALYSTSWDYLPHRLLLEKAVELGFLNRLPSDEEIFAP